MVHLAFKHVAVIASSLMIFAIAQAETRAEKKQDHIDHVRTDAAADGKTKTKEKLAVEKMQDRMKRNNHHARQKPTPPPKSALKK